MTRLYITLAFIYKYVYYQIMKNNVTIKDIAKEAKVSVATVSYVLNNRCDQKISDETRNKVLHIANLLNYTPNRFARSLKNKPSNNIILYYKYSDNILVRSEQMHTLNSLSSLLHKNDYQLMSLNEENIKKYDWADVILTLDIKNDVFHKIGNLNFRPLIALNSFIDDPIFFQINQNYSLIKEKADNYFKNKSYTFLSLPINNNNRYNIVKNTFDNVKIIENLDDLNKFKEKNILIIDDTLNEVSYDFMNKFYIKNYISSEDAKILDAINWATNREKNKHHNILI